MLQLIRSTGSGPGSGTPQGSRYRGRISGRLSRVELRASLRLSSSQLARTLAGCRRSTSTSTSKASASHRCQLGMDRLQRPGGPDRGRRGDGSGIAGQRARQPGHRIGSAVVDPLLRTRPEQVPGQSRPSVFAGSGRGSTPTACGGGGLDRRAGGPGTGPGHAWHGWPRETCPRCPARRWHGAGTGAEGPHGPGGARPGEPDDEDRTDGIRHRPALAPAVGPASGAVTWGTAPMRDATTPPGMPIDLGASVPVPTLGREVILCLR